MKSTRSKTKRERPPWWRRSLVPAAQLLALYSSIAIGYLLMTVWAPWPIAQATSLAIERLLPERIVARALGTAAVDHARVPIPGRSVVAVGDEWFFTSYVELDESAWSESSMADMSCVTLTTASAHDEAALQIWSPASIDIVYRSAGRVGVPYADLDGPAGDYFVTTSTRGCPGVETDGAQPTLVIGPSYPYLLNRLLQRMAAALGIVSVIAVAILRGARWIANRAERRDERTRKANRRMTWHELQQEKRGGRDC